MPHAYLWLFALLFAALLALLLPGGANRENARTRIVVEWSEDYADTSASFVEERSMSACRLFEAAVARDDRAGRERVGVSCDVERRS